MPLIRYSTLGKKGIQDRLIDEVNSVCLLTGADRGFHVSHAAFTNGEGRRAHQRGCRPMSRAQAPRQQDQRLRGWDRHEPRCSIGGIDSVSTVHGLETLPESPSLRPDQSTYRSLPSLDRTRLCRVKARPLSTMRLIVFFTADGGPHAWSHRQARASRATMCTS